MYVSVISDGISVAVTHIGKELVLIYVQELL